MSIEGFGWYGGHQTCGNRLGWGCGVLVGESTGTDLEGLEWVWNVWNGYRGSRVGEEGLRWVQRGLGGCRGLEMGLKCFR